MPSVLASPRRFSAILRPNLPLETHQQQHPIGRDPDWNHEILAGLEPHRDALESACACYLEWDEMEGRWRCGIVNELPGGRYRNDPDDWPAIQDRMFKALIRLQEAVESYLPKLT